MKLYIATMNCGDVYCACNGYGHIIGAYKTRELAEDAQKIADELPLEGSVHNSSAYLGAEKIIEVEVGHPPLGRSLDE